MPDRFQLLTFNVFHDYPEQRQGLRRLELLADAVAADPPEVLLLQELFVSRTLGNAVEALSAMLRERGLRYDHHYAAANGSFAENGEFEEGSAVFSVFPIVDAAVHPLAPGVEVRRRVGDYEYVERRIAVRATLAPRADRTLDAYSVHVTDLGGDEGEAARIAQIRHLAEIVARRPSPALPALVGGDLNAEPHDEGPRWLTAAGYLDLLADHPHLLSSASAGRHPEAPHDGADRRIDYLLVADADPTRVVVHDARSLLDRPAPVSPGGVIWASDHNALRVDLTLD